MRWSSLLGLLLVGGIAAGLVSLATRSAATGVGFFDQEIVVESANSVQRVAYCCWDVDAETRQRAERTADPQLFECRPAEGLGGNRYSAKVMCTTRSGLFREQVFHPKQLIVYAEFADGTRQCRIIDLPEGRGENVVVVGLK
jgi:hypothetical protein